MVVLVLTLLPCSKPSDFRSSSTHSWNSSVSKYWKKDQKCTVREVCEYNIYLEEIRHHSHLNILPCQRQSSIELTKMWIIMEMSKKCITISKSCSWQEGEETYLWHQRKNHLGKLLNKNGMSSKAVKNIPVWKINFTNYWFQDCLAVRRY